MEAIIGDILYFVGVILGLILARVVYYVVIYFTDKK
jgi:hypothetical protein